MGKAVADVGATIASRTFIKKRARKQVGRFTWYQGKPLQRMMIVRDDRRLGSTHVGCHLALGQTTHQWVAPQRRGAHRQGAMPIPRDEYREYIFDYSIQRTYEWVQAYFTVEHYRWIECSSRRQGGFWYFEFDEQVSWWYFLVGNGPELGGA